jgi:hypothetical protein
VQNGATWRNIFDLAGSFNRAIVEVREYDENAEISEQQRKWLHCEAGPIRELMRSGWSFREAKEHCKVEWGRPWFVVELTDDNFKDVDGIFRWECRKSLCRKIIHPLDVISDVSTDTGEVIHVCPSCSSDIFPIALKSIMDVSVAKTNLWFAEIWAHFPKNEDGTPRVQQPDPNWSKKKEKKNER